MTEEQLLKLIEQHGGLVSRTQTKDIDQVTMQQNPGAPWRFLMGDGTWVTVRVEDDTANPQPNMGPGMGPSFGKTYTVLDSGQESGIFKQQADSAPNVKQGPDGNWYQWDGKQWAPAPGMPSASTNPLDEQEQRLDIEKKQQGLASEFERLMAEQEKALAMAQEQYRSGKWTRQQADQHMEQVNAYISAKLKGTTPYEMEQDAYTRQRNAATDTRQAEQYRSGLAGDVLSDQLGRGSSLATGLMSGLNEGYSHILSSTNPPYLDPLAMAKQFTESIYGPQNSELARSVLGGALGTAPTAAPMPMPGDYSAFGGPKLRPAPSNMPQPGPNPGALPGVSMPPSAIAQGLAQGMGQAGTPDQYRQMVSRYFPPEVVDNILKIMALESGGNPGASNTNGEDSWGLMQVNRVAHPQWSIEQLKDPETNIRAAAEIWKAGGYAPWLNASRQLGLLQ